MIFALTYLAAILIPGFLIARWFDIKNQILLFSLSLSLAYFVLLLFVSIYLRIDVTAFFTAYVIGLICLTLFCSMKRKLSINLDRHELIGGLIVLIVSSIYLTLVGFYDELPGDVYKHLEYFKEISNQLNTGKFKSTTELEIFRKSVLYWYHLPILISQLTQAEFINHLATYAAINVITLLICVYSFAFWLFQTAIQNRIQLVIASLFSVFFFAVHFGINVFAFIRYYSVAPTILNYIVYLTAIICLMNYYRSEMNFFKLCLTSTILFFTAYLIHSQEAMFIGMICIVITGILFIKKLSTSIPSPNYSVDASPNSIVTIFPMILLILIGTYFYIVNHLPLTQIIRPKIIPINDLIDFGHNSFILNPLFQFYTVLTHWGLFISMLYILFYKRYFNNQPILLAGMLIPILTVFNPFFTNFFLRIAYSDVLWRFLYMLPLYLIAARLVTGLLFEEKIHLTRKITNTIVIGLTFIFLFPINISPINLPFSRIYSLKPVHHQAHYSYWQDMLDYLHTLQNTEIIITDPVTGYMISALTKHKNRRYKFYIHRMKDPYNFKHYTDHPLQKYNGKILIINQRKGMSTKTAKIATHWNPHTLKFTEYYSDELITHVDNEPSHFRLLWKTDDIYIYRIKY